MTILHVRVKATGELDRVFSEKFNPDLHELLEPTEVTVVLEKPVEIETPVEVKPKKRLNRVYKKKND